MTGTRNAAAERRSGPPDERELRRVLGAFATGVAVLTTLGEGGAPVGVTVNSFNSVSLDPPLVLWSLSLDAPSLHAFRTHEFFAVNILAEHQAGLCAQFATPAQDKFAGVGSRPGIGGAPLLDGAAAWLECGLCARYPGGDHEIFVGEILSAGDGGHEPLVVHRGGYWRLAPL